MLTLCHRLASLLLLPAAAAAAAAPSNGAPALRDPHLSECGVLIVTGITEAFLHREHVTKEELRCIVPQLGNAAYAAYESATSVAAAVEGIAHLGRGSPAVGGEAGAAVGKIAAAVRSVVQLDSDVKECFKGPSLHALEAAAAHLTNASYVMGCLVVNGADILGELTDAAVALQRGKCGRFGRGIGFSLRKVLLWNATARAAPEGPPSPEQLINTTAGLLQGFFGKGFELDISSDQHISTSPLPSTMSFALQLPHHGDGPAKSAPVPQAGKGLHVHVDLHKCVSRNLHYFRFVMKQLWMHFVTLAFLVETLPLQTSINSAELFGAAKTLSRSLAKHAAKGLSHALAECGVGKEQQAMLAEAAQSLDHMHLRLSLPQPGDIAAEDAAKAMKKAATDWSKMDYFGFGESLGTMLCGLVLQAHPKRYAVSSGTLVADLPDLEATAEAALSPSGPAERTEPPTMGELSRGGYASADEFGVGSGLSKNGAQIVRGVTEGFLHRGTLSDAEMSCLVRTVGKASSGALEAATDIAEIFEDAFRGLVSGPRKTVDRLMRSVRGVLKVAEGFMASCIHGPAERAIEAAAARLWDLDYVAGHILANGADILQELEQAVAAFERYDGASFGRHLGRAGRKVVLSKAPVPSLPEGPVALPALVNVSVGLLQGFFGPGFELDVSSDKKIVTTRVEDLADILSQPAGTKPQISSHGERLSLHIDMHKCISKDLHFWQTIMAGAFHFLALEELSLHSGHASTFIMMALGQLPGALKKCGLSEKKVQMLIQSADALKGLHVELHLPADGGHGVSPLDRVRRHLQEASQDWAKESWLALGEDLGHLLGDLLFDVFPQLYSVGGAGGLRQQLASSGPAPIAWLLLPLAALPLLAAVAAARGRGWRSSRASGRAEFGRQPDIEGILADLSAADRGALE